MKSVNLQMGSLYYIVNNAIINLYSYDEVSESYYMSLFQKHPKNNVFIYIGARQTCVNFAIKNILTYYKFLNGANIVYMLKAVYYLEKLG